MSTLTSILLRAGWLTNDEVDRVIAFRREHRTNWPEALLELGLADEPTLVRFLQSKLMIPMATPTVLRNVEDLTLRQVPGELAWLHDVMPISVDDVGNLTLAMADPTDSRAVEAIAAHSGAYIVRAVAPLGPLRAALQQAYGPRPVERGTPRDPAPHDRTPQLGTPGVVVPDDSRPLSLASVAAVLPRITHAADRDEITELFLDFLGTGFRRVILFIHLHDQLRGRDARGPDLVIEAVTQVRIPTTGPSLFRDVIERGDVYRGPWPVQRPIDRAFAQALGDMSSEVLLVPIRLRERVPLLVFADIGVPRAERFEVAHIEQLSLAMSVALERLIYRRKSGDTIPPVG